MIVHDATGSDDTISHELPFRVDKVSVTQFIVLYGKECLLRRFLSAST